MTMGQREPGRQHPDDRSAHGGTRGHRLGSAQAIALSSIIPGMGSSDPQDVLPSATQSRMRLAAVPMLAGTGVLVGLWTAASIFVGPQLDLGPRRAELELVDHVVPGTVVIILSLAGALALVGKRRPLRAVPSLLYYLGLGITLAGLWTTATHVPLVLQALRNQAPWPAALNYSIPAFTLFFFGLAWSFLYRHPLSSEPAAPH